MAHQRTLIRYAYIAALTGATAAGARVYNTRVDPHRKGALPALSVYTLGEESADTSSTPRELARAVRVEIAGWASGTDSGEVADALDVIAAQVEAVIDADPYLGGAASDSVLESTTIEIREDDGRSSPLIGIVTLTYSVSYYTSPAAPSLDDFIRAGAVHKFVGSTEDGAPRDSFVVSELGAFSFGFDQGFS